MQSSNRGRHLQDSGSAMWKLPHYCNQKRIPPGNPGTYRNSQSRRTGRAECPAGPLCQHYAGYRRGYTQTPDTVIVVTTNNNYAGCRDMNQSVISRMNLIIDMEDPDTDILAERAMKVTGCSDKNHCHRYGGNSS